MTAGVATVDPEGGGEPVIVVLRRVPARATATGARIAGAAGDRLASPVGRPSGDGRGGAARSLEEEDR